MTPLSLLNKNEMCKPKAVPTATWTLTKLKWTFNDVTKRRIEGFTRAGCPKLSDRNGKTSSANPFQNQVGTKCEFNI